MDTDEIELWQTMRRLTDSISTVPDIIVELGIDRQRAEQILRKWADKGMYIHGPDIFAGWLTERYLRKTKANEQSTTTH